MKREKSENNKRRHRVRAYKKQNKNREQLIVNSQSLRRARVLVDFLRVCQRLTFVWEYVSICASDLSQVIIFGTGIFYQYTRT